MTESERICRVIGQALTRNEVIACAFLESRGYGFGVQFHRDDCTKVAADTYLREVAVSQATLVYDLSSRTWRKRA